MADPYAELREKLAVANRVLANEGIIDASVTSARAPDESEPLFHLPPSRLGAGRAIRHLEMTLDSEPVVPTKRAALQRDGDLRRDLQSAARRQLGLPPPCPAVLPFCATGVELVPLFHFGGTLGDRVPFWDSRDEFGDTNLLVRTPEEGASHARALGPHFMLLLRRHGASLVGNRCANASSAASTPRATPSCSCARWRSDAEPAVARRGREVRRPQSRNARRRARLGILGDPPAKGGSDLGGRRAAAHAGPRRDRAPADRGAAAGKVRGAQRPAKPEERASESRRKRMIAAPGALLEDGKNRGRIHNSYSRYARLSPKTLRTRTPLHGRREINADRSGPIRCSIGRTAQWSPQHNWRKVEAGSEKEAAEKVCGLALKQDGKLRAAACARADSAISGSAAPRLLCGRVGSRRHSP